MDDSKDKATPQCGDDLGNKDVPSDAGEPAALILTHAGSELTTGYKDSGLDFPLEREYPPDGKHSGLVSSLVSRWESEARSQSPGQGLEPSLGATDGRF